MAIGEGSFLRPAAPFDWKPEGYIRLFLNLYFSSPAFRDHNWTDFYRDLRKVVGSVLQAQIYDQTVSRAGIDSELLATMRFTGSMRCAETFMRANPELPIKGRDYALSKLFQFIFVPIIMTYDYSDSDGRLSHELESFLDTIADPTDTMAELDWRAFYCDLRQRAHGPHTTVQRLPLYLPGATKKKSLSDRDRGVLEKIGEANLRTLSNSELQERYKRQLLEIFGRVEGEAVRSSLNRIRRKMGLPSSKSIRKGV